MSHKIAKQARKIAGYHRNLEREYAEVKKREVKVFSSTVGQDGKPEVLYTYHTHTRILHPNDPRARYQNLKRVLREYRA